MNMNLLRLFNGTMEPRVTPSMVYINFTIFNTSMLLFSPAAPDHSTFQPFVLLIHLTLLILSRVALSLRWYW